MAGYKQEAAIKAVRLAPAPRSGKPRETLMVAPFDAMPTTIDHGKALEVHSGKFTVDGARDRTSYYEVEYGHESVVFWSPRGR